MLHKHTIALVHIHTRTRTHTQTHTHTRTENEIDGEALLAMDHETLKSMGVGVAGKRVKILNTLKVLKMVISAPHVTECGGV